MIGKLIDERYRIESEAAVGGMAEVYRAYDMIEDRIVAIKLIKREYCEEPQYIRRFEREAEAVLSLDSPNIVRAYGYGVYEGRGYIVFEYIEGKTLKEMLTTEGRLGLKEAVHTATKVLDALECAHEAGYVHRDVKPQNVLISGDGEIKLADFGIAKSALKGTKTFEGKVLGSVQYISPEQASGLTVNEKSDLYSVGIMLYEMLVGEPPFDGDDNLQIVMQHITDPVPSPRDIDPTIPKAISDVVLKATAKNRDLRYAYAADMKRDLERAIEHPNSRFAHTAPARRVRFNKDGDNGDDNVTKVKLWHILLPITCVALIVAAIIGVSSIWGGSAKSGYSKVPDIMNKTLAGAERALENRELKIQYMGTISDSEYASGRVCRQEPSSGKTLKKDEYVKIWISSGSGITTVEMPDLVGKTLTKAKEKIEALGLRIESVEYIPSDRPEGEIVRQEPFAGTEMTVDTGIKLYVSGNPDTTAAP
ncbi:MAG: Stk1 family PASTA domain-containing Ser/Thr kinase [Clostridia bacterium]|nr:Stk1 family PASTA domain-containing Ser/Thr kinase [Clostridia bacterium]